jgi:CBS domain-containing protein
MKVNKVALVPPPAVAVTATIKEAIPVMVSEHGCAAAVIDGKQLVGTLSKEEILQRVIGEGLNPETTTVGRIMTAQPKTVTTETDTEEALKLMFALRQCYLPVVSQEGDLKGWLAICSLFENSTEDLVRQLDSITAYLGADGPGGD